MGKVKYRCVCCGWTKELPIEWQDVKPRFCPTPTCEMSVKKSRGKKSFRLTPEKLEILEIKDKPVVEQKQSKPRRSRK